MKPRVANNATSAEMDNALPCPFCGGEAVFEDSRPRGSCYYQCGRCGASTGSGSCTERDALADWNNRV